MEMKENVCYNCGAELANTYAEKEIIKRLEQENAELKNQIRIAGIIIEQANDKIPKYKQTLNAIKEIAEKDFRHTSWEDYKEQLVQILDLIKESEQ